MSLYQNGVKKNFRNGDEVFIAQYSYLNGTPFFSVSRAMKLLNTSSMRLQE